MTTEITNWRTPRAKVGALSRSRLATDPELVAARLDLRAGRLAEHIQRVVADAPPLTASQIDRLSALLQGGADHDAP